MEKILKLAEDNGRTLYIMASRIIYFTPCDREHEDAGPTEISMDFGRTFMVRESIKEIVDMLNS